jgi:hypothetical protein
MTWDWTVPAAVALIVVVVIAFMLRPPKVKR